MSAGARSVQQRLSITQTLRSRRFVSRAIIWQIVVSQVSAQLQAGLFEIQQIARASSIPKHIQDSLVAVFEKLAKNLTSNTFGVR
jgi:transcription initiation factor TFIIIB Brf1 subunit/transcription initiation factor TFIIB